ncbi:hypothetical protein RRG08_032658 [Elysia crispata]|uniref:Uncharacterized protein n=1 Tax=Elysia crispata TaxID=231223 RepID=A0AAE0Y014_9GAST|nr:hypothetical protein RRG08_032658 [Elysia crispata]
MRNALDSASAVLSVVASVLWPGEPDARCSGSEAHLNLWSEVLRKHHFEQSALKVSQEQIRVKTFEEFRNRARETYII